MVKEAGFGRGHPRKHTGARKKIERDREGRPPPTPTMSLPGRLPPFSPAHSQRGLEGSRGIGRGVSLRGLVWGAW